MERLTNEAWRNFDPWECCGQDEYCQRGCHDPGGCTKGCIVPRLYARLGAYEDTGLAPEEILNVKRLLEERNYALKCHLELLKEQLRCDERDRDLSELLPGPGDAKFSAGRCEATKEEIGWLERMVIDG